MPDVTLTEAMLAQIEARAKAATPGPWDGSGLEFAVSRSDAAFIAAARADIPALIAALRAGRERERRLLLASQASHDKDEDGVCHGYREPWRPCEECAALETAQAASRAALGEEAPHA